MEDPWLIGVGRRLRSFSRETNLFGGATVEDNTRELEQHVGHVTHHIIGWAADIQNSVCYCNVYPSVNMWLLT